MNQDQQYISILHMFNHPVFRVEKGKIAEANNAASQLQFTVGTDITPLLHTGAEAYEQFTSGALSLSLIVNDTVYLAGVLCAENGHIFHVQSEPSEELNTVALAAQHLREPISNIMTVAELALPELQRAGTKMQQHYATMNKSLSRLHRMISNMADSAGRKMLTGNMEVLDATAVIAEAAEAASALLEHTEHSLHYHGLNEAIYTLADRDMLERGLYNMISNAVKYSPKGSAVNVHLSKGERKLLLTVENPCGPLSAALLGTIFTRYQRAPGIEDGRNGIGFGIPIIRSVAASHGGSLLLTQEKDHTVRFTMTIAIREGTPGTLRSPLTGIDYTGGRSHVLTELSDILPASLFNDVI